MKLLTFRYARQANPVDHAGVVVEGGIAPILEINSKFDKHYPNNLLDLIRAGAKDIPTQGIPPIPFEQVEPRLPYNVPPKIWCIGLNYHSHAVDINAVQPEEPGSFMKPASCMFQPDTEIVLPPAEFSDDVDAEVEHQPQVWSTDFPDDIRCQFNSVQEIARSVVVVQRLDEDRYFISRRFASICEIIAECSASSRPR